MARTTNFVVGGGRGRGQGVMADQNGGRSYDKGYIDGSNVKKKQSEGGTATKLFDKSVPKTATKENVRPTFEEHGHVIAFAKNKKARQQGVVGFDQSSGRGQGVVGVHQSGGRGKGLNQGSILGSSDTVGLQSDAHQIEDSDGDDVSSIHVASKRRGSASQVQVPEPVNREWIYIKDGEFSNQITSTRRIGVILKGMWSGPWESWKDVPNEDKKRLFQRFQCYFQWEEKWNAEIYTCWERCIAGKIPDTLCRARDAAKAMARRKCIQFDDDWSVLVEYKPPWIKMETWKQMIEIWNTPEWKAMSKRNKKIRNESKGGKHTLGSQTYVTAKRKVANIIGHEPSHSEMWKQTHLRKGSRPFDNVLDGSSSVGESIDIEDIDLEDLELEGNLQEKELAWVDNRSHETLDKYEEYLVEKYGGVCSQHPKLDQDLWYQAAGGKKKGKVYGLSNFKEPYVHGKQEHEIARLNEVIAGLLMEKEQDKAEKEAINERMSNIEAMLKARFEKV